VIAGDRQTCLGDELVRRVAFNYGSGRHSRDEMTDNFTFQATTTVGRRTFVVERVSDSGERWSYRTKGHRLEAIQLDAGACGGVDETVDQVQGRVVRAFDQYIQHRPTHR
jgi:hypothetical protein